jgi:hypothetical protein
MIGTLAEVAAAMDLSFFSSMRILLALAASSAKFLTMVSSFLGSPAADVEGSCGGVRLRVRRPEE